MRRSSFTPADDLRSLATQGRFLSIDIEGDGHNPPAPVEIAIVTYGGGTVIDRHYWLLNPGRPMTDFVQGHHGITDEMVKDCPTFEEVSDQLFALIEGEHLAGHNIREDLRILETVAPEISHLPATILDTQRLAKSLLEKTGFSNLKHVSERLGVVAEDAATAYRGGLHTAMHDADLTGQSFIQLALKVPESRKQVRHFASMAAVRPTPTSPGPRSTGSCRP